MTIFFPFSTDRPPPSSFPVPVPPPANAPAQGKQIQVCFSEDWLPYVLGSLFQLTMNTTWQAATPDDLLVIQGQANDLILLFQQAKPCQPPLLEAGYEDANDMSLFRVDCNCNVFVKCCDGTERQILTGQQVMNLQAGQPGAGSGSPPPNGGAQQYCFKQTGSATRLIPFTVSTGDTIEFSDLNGAWNDTREIIWNCPDGWVFTLDTCGQTFPHGSPDPLPTALHMSLIVSIGGTYYDALNLDSTGHPRVFTVPSGISNAQVLIVANTDAPNDTTGEVSYCVTVTNNFAPPWEHTVDLTAAPYIFSPGRPDSGDVRGDWSPTVGWIGTNDTDGAKLLTIQGTISPSISVTQVDFLINVSNWTSHVNGEYQLGGTLTSLPTLAEGDNVIPISFPGSLGFIYFGIGAGGQPSTQFTLTGITFHGNGVNPFL